MGNFDPYDWEALYFGSVSRSEANDLLNDLEDGQFFVRDSTTLAGEFVLSVKEPQRVCHYLISKLPPDAADGRPRYKIGDNHFPDVPSLLNFYKSHYLESTHLVGIAPRRQEEYRALFDFAGQEASDLSFAKGERLWVLRKEAGSSWWEAKNEEGRVGAVPSTYLAQAEETASPDPSARLSLDPSVSSGDSAGSSRPPSDGSVDRSSARLSDPDASNANPAARAPRTLPAWATVTRNRNPNAYDPSQLRLTKGARIRVEKQDVNGTWFGTLTEGGAERRGTFPFTFIRFDDPQPSPASPNNND